MQNNYSKGNHGYDNNHTDMHGVFIAKGPSFKENYKTGTIWNVDINPLLCKIFGISPRTNIDGKLERIEFILSEN
jgi:predicted AlkP superfamily pyrophosphatase or phosphodiesterase